MALSPELYQALHAAPVAASHTNYEQYFLMTYISAPVHSQMSNIILALTNRHIHLSWKVLLYDRLWVYRNKTETPVYSQSAVKENENVLNGMPTFLINKQSPQNIS
jgi:hypothetical protein